MTASLEAGHANGRQEERKGVPMSYEKPEVKKVQISVSVNMQASDRSSCDGGHCVRKMYEGDH